MGVRDALSIVWSILTAKWYWFIVIMASSIIITPFLMLMLILRLPSPLNFLSTILIVVGWGVVAGYKDWIIARAKEEERKIKP